MNNNYVTKYYANGNITVYSSEPRYAPTRITLGKAAQKYLVFSIYFGNKNPTEWDLPRT